MESHPLEVKGTFLDLYSPEGRFRQVYEEERMDLFTSLPTTLPAFWSCSFNNSSRSFPRVLSSSMPFLPACLLRALSLLGSSMLSVVLFLLR